MELTIRNRGHPGDVEGEVGELADLTRLAFRIVDDVAVGDREPAETAPASM